MPNGAMYSRAFIDKIEQQGGFVTMEDVAQIERIEPHQILLVRCGNGRFLAPAQNVEHFVEVVNGSSAKRPDGFSGHWDYVRDVSFTATDYDILMASRPRSVEHCTSFAFADGVSHE